MAADERASAFRVLDLVKRSLVPFAERAFEKQFGGFWPEKVRDRVPATSLGSNGRPKWDAQAVLKAVRVTWNEVFRSLLSEHSLTYVVELLHFRNDVVHDKVALTPDYVRRGADTARLLAVAIDDKVAAGELATFLAPTIPAAPVAPIPASSPKVVGHDDIRDLPEGVSPWDVLQDQRLLSLARERFGVASLNPFYSNPDRTLRESTLYIVSQNPGGKAAAIPSQTRDKPLDHPPRAASRTDWCKILDESWGEDGTNYQRNLKWLADRLLDSGSEALRTTFCTNAVFARGDLTANGAGAALWSACRPWHQAWLGVVKPRVLLCLGNAEEMSSYTWLTRLVEVQRQLPDTPTYNRSFRLKACEGLLNGSPVLVLGTPHPARWHPSRSEGAITEVMRLLRTAGRRGR